VKAVTASPVGETPQTDDLRQSRWARRERPLRVSGLASRAGTASHKPFGITQAPENILDAPVFAVAHRVRCITGHGDAIDVERIAQDEAKGLGVA
jgi:hypothetical protein